MEVLSLKWDYLNLNSGQATLPDSKTGFKVVPLSLPAVEILQKIPIADQYVFPSSTSASGHMEGLRKPWQLMLTAAKLAGHWRVHDLRHAFASMMVNSGASLPVIGKVLGHATPSTTARYAHLGKNPALQAAEEAAAKIATAWENNLQQQTTTTSNDIRGNLLLLFRGSAPNPARHVPGPVQILRIWYCRTISLLSVGLFLS